MVFHQARGLPALLLGVALYARCSLASGPAVNTGAGSGDDDATEEERWTVTCSDECEDETACSSVCNGSDEEWAICAPLGECSPDIDIVGKSGGHTASGHERRDCDLGVWSDWQVESDSKVCSRHRKLTANMQSGAPCSGTLAESKLCSTDPAKVSRHYCKFADWSDWYDTETAKDWGVCDASTRAWRKRRSVSDVTADEAHAEANNYSASCQGALTIIAPCNQSAYIADACEVSPWMSWTGCSRSCGGGQRTRSRSISRENERGGPGCDFVLSEAEACATNDCRGLEPVDCTLTAWSDWSSCQNGQSERERKVAQPAMRGGKTCSASTAELRTCQGAHGFQPRLPQDCQLGTWSLWNLCTKTCGGGQTFRMRDIKVPALNGGRPCSNILAEVQPCNEFPCDVSRPSFGCSLALWSEWSLCQRQQGAQCGQGVQSRTRAIVAEAQGSGYGCNAQLEEVKACEDAVACQTKDCVWGDWSMWGAPCPPCGQAHQTRMRTVVVETSGGGALCNSTGTDKEQRVCPRAPECPPERVDGVFSDWAEWSVCSTSCGDGQQWRNRTTIQEASIWGFPVEGNSTEVRHCSIKPCIVATDCRAAPWQDWSLCSASCEGSQSRTRMAPGLFNGSGAGKWCEDTPLAEMRSCNGPDEYKNGLGAQMCNFGEPQNCTFNLWMDWADCTASCGGGSRQRSRTVLQEAKSHGRPCYGALTEIGPCSTQPCDPVPVCLWEDWNDWFACTACGPSGKMSRIRQPKTVASVGSTPCRPDDAMETRVCDTPCPKTAFCVWSDWGQPTACTRTCGTGKRQRVRNATTLATMPADPSLVIGYLNGTGKVCTGGEVKYEACSAQSECDVCVPRNCQFGSWSDWAEPSCAGLCTRSRKIDALPNECGTLCEGVLNDTKLCDPPESCMHDKPCEFETWSDWDSHCNDEHPEGQAYRSRKMKTPAGILGPGCIGPVTETRPCERRGKVTDCKFGEWSGWSKCHPSCGQGTREASREIVHNNTAGGAPCNGPLVRQEQCPLTPCPGVDKVDCAFVDWSPWHGCDAEHPQAHRTRRISRPAKYGGEPCIGALTEAGTCPEDKIRDCKMGDWADWGDCSTSCGGGQRFRLATTEVAVANQGKPCDNITQEVMPCGEMPCPGDCVANDWQDWGKCSAPCGYSGQRTRIRSLQAASRKGGLGCRGPVAETKSCKGACDHGSADEKATDACSWNPWSDWGECQPAEYCGAGTRTRSRLLRGAHGHCPPGASEEVKAFADCPGRCNCTASFLDWDDWSVCSKTCGDRGTRWRRRKEEAVPGCFGHAVGNSSEFGPCSANVACQATDCEFEDWDNWDSCSGSCHGTQHRGRAVKMEARSGGQPCVGPLREAKACGNRLQGEGCELATPVDCEQESWGAWSACSVDCGEKVHGHRTRERRIRTYPRFGGKACDNPLKEASDCFVNTKCSENRMCAWSWSDWSTCGKGDKRQKRSRSLPEANSEHCQGPAEEVRECPKTACKGSPHHCYWETWSMWGQCSLHCGKSWERGRKRRSRKLVVESALTPLGSLAEVPQGAETISRSDAAHKVALVMSAEGAAAGSGALGVLPEELAAAFTLGALVCTVVVGISSTSSWRWLWSTGVHRGDWSMPLAQDSPPGSPRSSSLPEGPGRWRQEQEDSSPHDA